MKPLPFLLAIGIAVPLSAETSASGESVAVENELSTEIDPFAESASSEVTPPPMQRLQQPRRSLRFRLEVWEGPALAIARGLDSVTSPNSLAAFRASCLDGQSGFRLVHSPVVALSERTRGTTGSITEVIYPTEYEPPRPPPAPAASKTPDPQLESLLRWHDAVGKFTVPTSFEVRNVGETLEVVAFPVSVGENHWDVSFQYEIVEHPGDVNFGAPDLKISLPLFTNFRTGGMVRLGANQWRLHSVQNPPQAKAHGSGAVAPADRRVTLIRLEPDDS